MPFKNIVETLPIVTSFDTDPTALIKVHEYVPVSSLVGDVIVKQPSLTLPPTYFWLFISSSFPSFLHFMPFTLGDSSKTA